VSETKESQYLTIARIRKVWGRRGEVAAEILTDFPERFQAGEDVLLMRFGNRETLGLEGVWFHKGLTNLKFRGFDSISAAETLVGAEIQIPFADRMPLDPGEVFLSDLIGCSVLEEGSVLGQVLGHVESVQQTGAAPLLQVRTTEGEMLIPFAEEICRTVDIAGKQIHVRLPEGLRELNQKGSLGNRK
jgi:16S rRNA processing protein RimM